MENKIMKQKGFIAITLLIAIIVSIVVASTVTTGVVLHKKGKLVPLIANFSQIFKKAEEVDIEIVEQKSEEVEQEFEEAQAKVEEIEAETQKLEKEAEELEQQAETTKDELEKARLLAEAEKAKAEAEKAKAEAEKARVEVERLKKEVEEAKKSAEEAREQQDQESQSEESTQESFNPTIASISPNEILSNIDINITVSGTNFRPGATLIIGNLHLNTFDIISDRTIIFKYPRGHLTPGAYSITIRNQDGSEVSSASIFRIIDAATQTPSPPPPADLTIDKIARDIAEAIDPLNPITRDYAVRLASLWPGKTNIVQTILIYDDLNNYNKWKYVSDPNGFEYFSPASRTINLDLAGDCDDFAILMAALNEAIGQKSRIILAYDSNKGGHAYAEVYMGSQEQAKQTIEEVAYLYQSLGQGAVWHHIDGNGDWWLNMDWSNYFLPGKQFYSASEIYTIYPDGSYIKNPVLIPASISIPNFEPGPGEEEEEEEEPVTPGSLTTVLDYGTPTSANIAIGDYGTTGIIMTKIKLKASNEDINIDYVNLTRTSGGVGNNSDIAAIYLYEGNTLLATGILADNSKYRFNLTDYIIQTNGSKIWTVKADFNGRLTGATSGNQNAFDLTATSDLVAMGVSSGATINASATVFGNDKYLFRSIPFFEVITPSSTVLSSANDQEIIRIRITADSAGDIEFANNKGNFIRFTISGSVNDHIDSTTEDFVLKNITDSRTLDAINIDVSNTVAGSNKITFDFSGNSLQIGAGQSKIISVEADLGDFDDGGDTIQVSISNTTADFNWSDIDTDSISNNTYFIWLPLNGPSIVKPAT